MYLYTGSNKVNEVQILLDVDLSMPVRNYWPDSDLGTNPNLFNCIMMSCIEQDPKYICMYDPSFFSLNKSDPYPL